MQKIETLTLQVTYIVNHQQYSIPIKLSPAMLVKLELIWRNIRNNNFHFLKDLNTYTLITGLLTDYSTTQPAASCCLQAVKSNTVLRSWCLGGKWVYLVGENRFLAYERPFTHWGSGFTTSISVKRKVSINDNSSSAGNFQLSIITFRLTEIEECNIPVVWIQRL